MKPFGHAGDGFKSAPKVANDYSQLNHAEHLPARFQEQPA